MREDDTPFVKQPVDTELDPWLDDPAEGAVVVEDGVGDDDGVVGTWWRERRCLEKSGCGGEDGRGEEVEEGGEMERGFLKHEKRVMISDACERTLPPVIATKPDIRKPNSLSSHLRLSSSPVPKPGTRSPRASTACAPDLRSQLRS